MGRKALTQEEKDKKVAETQALRASSNLITHLEDLRLKVINTPSFQRKVGDRVKLGMIESSIIAEVLDGGKIYLLNQIHTEKIKGNPVKTHRQVYVAWQDVQNYQTPGEIKATEKFSYSDDVRMSQFNTHLDGIVARYYNNTNMNPEYQREAVWDLSDKVALIDSVFNNVDIGKFTFIRLPFNPDPHSFQYEILDGKQRLQALVDFVEGRFEYRGKKFQELHPMDQHHFESHSVVMTETDNLTFKQKCQYFLKLNTSGKPQSQEHMEKIRQMAKNSK